MGRGERVVHSELEEGLGLGIKVYLDLSCAIVNVRVFSRLLRSYEPISAEKKSMIRASHRVHFCVALLLKIPLAQWDCLANVNKEAPDVINGLRVHIDNGNDLAVITKERQLHGG
jgi:hypothetical protein